MFQLINFGSSNEETKSKIKIYEKTKQDKPFQLILTFSLWSTQEVKVKVNKRLKSTFKQCSTISMVQVGFRLSKLGHRSGCKDATITL